MPKWLKIVLGVGGALVLTCGLLVSGAAYWFNAHRGELKEKGEQVKADAQAFASTTDQAGCVKEVLARLKKTSGFMDEVQHRVFLSECLRQAADSKGFCDDVPARGEVLQTALWANSRCSDYDGPKEPCGRMMQEVVQFCARRDKAQTP
jgi:hypothetical protein